MKTVSRRSPIKGVRLSPYAIGVSNSNPRQELSSHPCQQMVWLYRLQDRDSMPNWYTINHPKTLHTHNETQWPHRWNPNKRTLFMAFLSITLKVPVLGNRNKSLQPWTKKSKIGINPWISILAEKYFLRGVCFPSEALQTCNVRNYYYREMAGGSRGAFW